MKTVEKQKVAFCCPHHGLLQRDVKYITADMGSKKMVSIPIMHCLECDEYYTPFTNLLAFAKLEYKGKKVLASQGRVEKSAPRIEVIKPYYEDVENVSTLSEGTNMAEERVAERTMPDLTKLNKVDIEYLCRRMSPTDIRSYFQKFPKDFTRIRPGFRPNALSDDDTINLMVRYSDKPFIWSFIENTVKLWFSEIDTFRKAQEKNGATPEESLLMAIPQSVFADNVELFISLCGEGYTTEYFTLLKTATTMLSKSNLATVPEQVGTDPATAEEITELSKRVEQLEGELGFERTAHRATVEALTEATEKNGLLQQSLSAAEARLDSAATRTVQMQEELELLRKLAKYPISIKLSPARI